MKFKFQYGVMLSLFLWGFSLQAQQKTKVKLFLKDGSFLYGTVVEDREEELLFEFQSGESITFSKVDIDSYAELEKDVNYFRGGKWHKKASGYYGVFSVNMMFGNSYDYFLDEPATAFEPVEAIVGYAFNKYVQIGLGSSLNILASNERVFVPIFAEYRISPWETSTSPFLAIGTGYAFAVSGIDEPNSWIQDYKGGFHFRTTLGVTFASRNKTKFQMGVHYQLQESTEDISSCGFFGCNENRRFITYKRFGLNLGLRF